MLILIIKTAPIVNAPSVNSFENRLDKQNWSNPDIIYNWPSEIICHLKQVKWFLHWLL